jgi:hypothetical protein
MKNLVRIILTFFAFIASYFFFYWSIPYSHIPGAQYFERHRNIPALIIAILIGIFLWKKLGKSNSSLPIYILMGGIIIGSIGFIIGFIGPIILTPSSNQGPLLGLLYTGPIGFILGLIGGGIYWQIKQRRKSTV